MNLMQLNITTTVKAALTQISNAQKQVKFAAARALTETAKDVQKAVQIGRAHV